MDEQPRKRDHLKIVPPLEEKRLSPEVSKKSLLANELSPELEASTRELAEMRGLDPDRVISMANAILPQLTEESTE